MVEGQASAFAGSLGERLRAQAALRFGGVRCVLLAALPRVFAICEIPAAP